MQTEIERLATRYPHLTAAFSTLPGGEAHLQRIQDLNASWQKLLLAGQTRQYTEVVTQGTRPALPPTATFDIIYAGGGLNVLNAAVMTLRYGLRVLVFDRFTVGAVHREWNISREELQELLAVGLLTQEELETVIQREYSSGLVRFSPEHIHTTPAELHLREVLNIAIDAEKLTRLCIEKILAHQPAGSHPNVVLNRTNFVRAITQPERVTVDLCDAAGEQQSYSAQLLVDGMGSTSPVACQLNCGRPFSLVCPTVGTVARGYKQGTAADAIDVQVGEVLVSTEDALNGRQLIWEAFPGENDQAAIYLFYYTEAGQRVDLLELFDDFFSLLPDYKDTSAVEIIKPVYGFIPAGYNITLPWQREQKTLATDRVISLGDAAAFQSPLTFCGFGSYVRNLRRITTLLHIALESKTLGAADLNCIRASESVPAVARAFSKFMIAKPSHVEPLWQVNETLNVFCQILGTLGPEVTNDFFKDRISWRDYTRLLLATPKHYPAIYALALKTLSPLEIVGWIAAWLQLAREATLYTLYHLLHPLFIRLPAPSLRQAIWREKMEQIERGKMPALSQTHRRQRKGIGYWLGRRWPHG